jgi:hypothetical protein
MYEAAGGDPFSASHCCTPDLHSLLCWCWLGWLGVQFWPTHKEGCELHLMGHDQELGLASPSCRSSTEVRWCCEVTIMAAK